MVFPPLPPDLPHGGILEEIRSGHCRDEVVGIEEYLEAFRKGRDDALNYLESVVGTDMDGWGPDRIADLHHHLFSWLYRDVGNFRRVGQLGNFGGRIAADTMFIRPELEALQKELASHYRWISCEMVESDIAEKLRLLAAFHGRLVFIHPFWDGNGRIARLATLWIERTLFPGTYFCDPGREKYFEGMRQLPRDIGPLMNWFAVHLGLRTDPFREIQPPFPVHVTRR